MQIIVSDDITESNSRFPEKQTTLLEQNKQAGKDRSCSAAFADEC